MPDEERKKVTVSMSDLVGVTVDSNVDAVQTIAILQMGMAAIQQQLMGNAQVKFTNGPLRTQ